ncbi:MAG: DNA photolyase, partial [Gammaproteobacteria bacterium]
LGWRWVCGLHTRGQTYLARPGNIAKYTDGRFDPAGRLAERATPLEETEPPAPQPLEELPEHVSPQNAWGLLITEDDCHAESLGLCQTGTPAPSAVLGLLASADRAPGFVSPAVLAFSRGAVEDAVARAGASVGLDPGASTVDAASPDWGESLVAWARRHGLSAIVSAHAPVGPAADRLARARPVLEAKRIRLLRLRRGWDTRAWAFADRGYFKLRKRIPRLLSAAGLPEL